MTEYSDNLTDKTKAPERIWFTDGMSGPWFIPPAGLSTAYIRADLAAEQVKQAYECGLDDAAKAMFSAANAAVEVFDTEDEIDAVDYQLQEGLRLIRALKSNDTNVGQS